MLKQECPGANTRVEIGRKVDQERVKDKKRELKKTCGFPGGRLPPNEWAFCLSAVLLYGFRTWIWCVYSALHLLA